MTDLPLDKAVFVISIAVYTLVTAWTDLRSRKIYNVVTVPMWLAGWSYQAAFHGWEGVLLGFGGFAVGFGLFFVLWMIGSVGGGDVKLLGALSVWLGAALTLKVVLASLIFVVIGTVGMIALGFGRRGAAGINANDVQPAAVPAKDQPESIRRRAQRRVMGFSAPVALATWSVLVLFQNQW